MNRNDNDNMESDDIPRQTHHQSNQYLNDVLNGDMHKYHTHSHDLNFDNINFDDDDDSSSSMSFSLTDDDSYESFLERTRKKAEGEGLSCKTTSTTTSNTPSPTSSTDEVNYSSDYQKQQQQLEEKRQPREEENNMDQDHDKPSNNMRAALGNTIHRNSYHNHYARDEEEPQHVSNKRFKNEKMRSSSNSDNLETISPSNNNNIVASSSMRYFTFQNLPVDARDDDERNTIASSAFSSPSTATMVSPSALTIPSSLSEDSVPIRNLKSPQNSVSLDSIEKARFDVDDLQFSGSSDDAGSAKEVQSLCSGTISTITNGDFCTFVTKTEDLSQPYRRNESQKYGSRALEPHPEEVSNTRRVKSFYRMNSRGTSNSSGSRILRKTNPRRNALLIIGSVILLTIVILIVFITFYPSMKNKEKGSNEGETTYDDLYQNSNSVDNGDLSQAERDGNAKNESLNLANETSITIPVMNSSENEPLNLADETSITIPVMNSSETVTGVTSDTNQTHALHDEDTKNLTLIENQTIFSQTHVDTEDVIRIEEITSLISMVSSENDLTNSSSPQSKALNWIIKEDPLRLDSSSSHLLQRYGAMVLYFSLGGGGWFFSTDFASEKHECEWFGITCFGGGSPVITEISLRQNNIKGIIPSEIMLFPLLQKLVLFQNDIRGTIPDTFYYLTHLEHLALFDNKIEGTLSPQIKSLKSLSYVNLRDNAFTGELPVFGNKIRKFIPVYHILYCFSNLNLTLRSSLLFQSLSSFMGTSSVATFLHF